MLLTSPRPPLTLAGFLRYCPTASSAAVGSAELNGMVWLTHLSYSCGPESRSMKSSIQSVSGQPVASPEPMPAHHGLMFLPLLAILSVRALSSSSVVGTVRPASLNIWGEYQTNDLTLAPSGAA